MNLDMGFFAVCCVVGCIVAVGVRIWQVMMIKRAEKAAALQKAEWEKRQEEIEEAKAERKRWEAEHSGRDFVYITDVAYGNIFNGLANCNQELP